MKKHLTYVILSLVTQLIKLVYFSVSRIYIPLDKWWIRTYWLVNKGGNENNFLRMYIYT